jgi:exopolysaccharide production protein ExoZ
LRFSAQFELFGAVSYVLYLVHPFAIGLTARAFAVTGLLSVVPGWSVIVVQVAVSAAIALIVHRTIELPLALWLRRFQ